MSRQHPSTLDRGITGIGIEVIDARALQPIVGVYPALFAGGRDSINGTSDELLRPVIGLATASISRPKASTGVIAESPAESDGCVAPERIEQPFKVAGH